MSNSSEHYESERARKKVVKPIAVTGISLLVVFLLFFIMGLSGGDSIAGLSTVDNSSLIEGNATGRDGTSVDGAGILKFDPVTKAEPDKIFLNAITDGDTTKTRVLFFGDSQVDHLRSPIYNYCVNNNCELVATIAWYGSTTVSWGEGDTLKNYLDKYKPDFVFCALGLNELFIPNVEPRRKSVNAITQAITNSGAKYYWIGPAAWKQDQGITSMLQEELGEQFYPSHKLTLERANDHRHPSRDGSKVWFDSVAVATTQHTRLDLSHTVTEYAQPKESPMIIIPMKK